METIPIIYSDTIELQYNLSFTVPSGFGCEDTPVLYNLAKRARHIEFQYLIDDFALDDGWFSATSQNITYVMVTNATLPPVGGCGALYSIYMLGMLAIENCSNYNDYLPCLSLCEMSKKKSIQYDVIKRLQVHPILNEETCFI